MLPKSIAHHLKKKSEKQNLRLEDSDERLYALSFKKFREFKEFP